jgi:hypothetical protein
MRDRTEPIPPEDSLEVAKRVKEMHRYFRRVCVQVPHRSRDLWSRSYVCPDIVKEYTKYDENPGKYFRKYEDIHSKTKKVGPFVFKCFHVSQFSEYRVSLTCSRGAVMLDTNGNATRRTHRV